MMLALLMSLGTARAEFCPQYDGFTISGPMGAVLGYLVVPEEPSGALLPGNEYWRWLVPSFPATFDVTGQQQAPPQSAWMGPVEIFPHRGFDVAGLVPYQQVQVGPEDRFYRIDVETSSGTVLAGWLFREQVSPLGYQHTWFGSPDNLVLSQAGEHLLAPFGQGAVVHFSPGTQPANGFPYAPLLP